MDPEVAVKVILATTLECALIADQHLRSKG